MSKLDHFVIVRMAEQDLSEDKNPPICDACNDSIEKQEGGLFHVQCLILEDSNDASFWGVICDKCKVNYHAKTPVKQATESEQRTIHAVLGRDMQVIMVDSLEDYPFE